MSDRKFFVGGNWKMNGNKASIDGIIGFLTAGPCDPNTGIKRSHICNYYKKPQLKYDLIFRKQNTRNSPPSNQA